MKQPSSIAAHNRTDRVDLKEIISGLRSLYFQIPMLLENQIQQRFLYFYIFIFLYFYIFIFLYFYIFIF
ncbi:MAG: hypothetical protein KUG53_04305, partial [Pseudomonadales bacterium]|nr:hypothetical protein [Pseudomonadales bacterium]